MRAVAHMEPQPLWQGEITERGMLHEQIAPASRQELVREREETRDAVPQLPFHRARIRAVGRFRHGGRTTARGNPPDIEIHKLSEPLSHGPRPAPHGELAATRLERASAAVDPDRQVMRDLRGTPLPGRSLVPIDLRVARE